MTTPKTYQYKQPQLLTSDIEKIQAKWITDYINETFSNDKNLIETFLNKRGQPLFPLQRDGETLIRSLSDGTIMNKLIEHITNIKTMSDGKVQREMSLQQKADKLVRSLNRAFIICPEYKELILATDLVSPTPDTIKPLLGLLLTLVNHSTRRNLMMIMKDQIFEELTFPSMGNESAEIFLLSWFNHKLSKKYPFSK